MPFSIREALLTDAATIATLSGQLGYTTTAEKTEARLLQLLNNDHHCVYVMLNNDTVVGWIHGFYSITVEYDPCIEIGGLVIDESHRRKGIGQMLVNKVVEWARTKNMNRIRVRSQVIRKEAHSFYLGLGFTPIKEQKVFDLIIAPGPI